MCLSEVKPFRPAKEGYQVKRKLPNGDYQSIYHYIRGDMRKGITYNAKRKVGKRYTTGFHVFHTLKDAEDYQNSAHCAEKHRGKTVVVRVKLGGKKVTGLQGYNNKKRRIRAKVTVCSKMTILHEV